MSESRTFRLQRAMASLILDDEPEDIGAPAERLGLPAGDQQAFRDQPEAMDLYRELARLSLTEPLETTFPVLKALLEGAEVWEDCAQAFLSARVVRSTHYRDIAPSFLGWLVDTGWGQDRWPFLAELAHAELLEVLVARFPEADPVQELHDEPGPGDVVWLDPGTQVVAYAHAVHRATEAAPVPEARPTHLLAFRDEEGEARVLELTAATAALLVQARTRPLAESAAALGLSDPAPALALLRDLRRQGAVLGFRAPH
ncbi:MAG TPA: putative DNA-binding domain-containing protein [Geothrix sp.]|nr:putative DNA-binding domain-containing protein [Geothrix sp.]